MARGIKDIVHDLANALTAIRGSADALRHEVDANEVLSRSVARIVDSADQAMALTRELRSALQPEDAPDLPWP